MAFPLPSDSDAAIVVSAVLDTSEFAKALADIEAMSQKSGEAMASAIQSPFLSALEQAEQRIQKFADASGASFKELVNNLDFVKEHVTSNTQVIEELGKKHETAWASVASGAGEATSSISKFIEGMVKLASVTGVILLLTKLWNGLKSAINEATEQFGEFSIAEFKLEVGVRAAQRLIGQAAGTTQEWTGFIADLREQFQIFSTKDLTAATSKVILLTRELGFNQEQMQQTTRSAIILAEITGTKVEEAARRLTLFLDTGYTRGLAQLGLQISKATVEQYALAQGINKTWNEMTRAERASLSLGVVIEQTGRLADDAGKIAETFQGQLNSLEAAQNDALVAAGESFQFIALAWARLKTFIVKQLPTVGNAIEAWAKKAIQDLGPVGTTVGGLASLFGRIADQGVIDFFVNFGENMTGIFEDAQGASEAFVDQLDNEFFPGLAELGNVGENEFGKFSTAVEEGEEALESFDSVVKKIAEELKREWERFTEGVTDAYRKMDEQIADLNRDFAFDIIDAARSLGFKLIDIDRKSADRRADIMIKHQQSLADLQFDAANKIAEKQADFRLNELQEQRKFDLEMAQLQRKYLFDLEDAVRERDARAVLDIMRRFNLDRQSAQEDFDLRRQEREGELAFEIEAIKRETEIRRLELERALQIRLRDLEISRQRERAAAREGYQRELDEIFLNEERRREQIQIMFDRRLAALRQHLEDRKALIAKSLVEEYQLTVDGANAMVNALSVALGNISSLFGNLFSQIRQGAAALGALGSNLSTTQYPGYNVQAIQSLRGVPIAGGFAQGGQIVATKPTVALFGEAGPEIGSFIPLNKMNDVGGAGGGRMGLDITVRTEEGLMVEIAEQVMSEVADVIISSEKERRR